MVPFLKKSLSIFLPLTRRGVLTSHLRGYSYSERRGSFMSDVKSSSSFAIPQASPCAHRNPLLENVLKILLESRVMLTFMSSEEKFSHKGAKAGW